MMFLLSLFFSFSWGGGAGIAHAGMNVWTSNGPEGGKVNALAVDPVNPAGPTATPTNTPPPCPEYPKAVLSFELTVAPPTPAVGDDVTLWFAVRNTSGGLAGLPNYWLTGAAPVFSGDQTPTTTGVASLGSETVTFHLHAAQAGTAQLELGVSYETAVGCIDNPFFEWSASTSPIFGVLVREAASTTCTGDCTRNGVVTVDELVTMANITLGNADVSICSAGDADHSGTITVDEIIQAVNNALNGCQEAPCKPIAGLTDCQADSDCVVADGIACCDCREGG